MLRALVGLAAALALLGCGPSVDDRLSESYAKGYADGYEQGKLDGAAMERDNAARQSSYEESSIAPHVVVEKCGGGTVTLNGKSIRSGKTGCVRVWSDGRSESF